MRRTKRSMLVGLIAGLLILGGGALAACGGQDMDVPPREVAGGDPSQGRQAISEYGCGSCHTVPGVTDADAHVGPPLTDFARRGYIGGQYPNEPENLIRWIQNPQGMIPETAMPNMGVTESDARDIAAYLYTLH